MFGLIFAAQALGRIFASPPEMPPERLKALRRAFMATMEDQQFLADAKTAQIDIVPNTGRGGRGADRALFRDPEGGRRAREAGVRSELSAARIDTVGQPMAVACRLLVSPLGLEPRTP